MFPRLRRSPTRTTLLGVAVLGVLIWMSESQLGVGLNNLLAQFLLLLAALVITIGLAASLFALSRLFMGSKPGLSERIGGLPRAEVNAPADTDVKAKTQASDNPE